jgi:hypothetical protein
MKKTYRSAQKSSALDPARLGAVLAIVAGVGVLAVAAFLLLRGSLAASPPSAGFTPQVQGGPRLSADKPKIDLGNVKLGQTVQASFEIANTGDQPLRFSEAPYIEVVEGC